MVLWHMSGAKNDFAVLDARDLSLDMSALAVKVCLMLGADGFMALDYSDVADFKLHFYNNDGSRAEMCGNGARCICRFAYDNGIAGAKMTVETDAGIVEGERISEEVYKIKLDPPKNIELAKSVRLSCVTVGVPHAVIELEGLDFDMADELFEYARALRRELDANVDFYSRLDGDTVRVLTYERGVEDFTLACGTGSAAVAVSLWSKGEFSGGRLTVKNKGGDLDVFVEAKERRISAVYLEGDAKLEGVEEY